MNYMRCIICDKSFGYSDTYGMAKCSHCGQTYEYDEGQMIKIDDSQLEALRGRPELLIKYMKHVIENEGTDFLSREHIIDDFNPFTEEEFKALQHISSLIEGGM